MPFLKALKSDCHGIHLSLRLVYFVVRPLPGAHLPSYEKYATAYNNFSDFFYIIEEMQRVKSSYFSTRCDAFSKLFF